MHHRWRGLFAMGGVLICLVMAAPAVAQDKPADNMDVLREKLRADKVLPAKKVARLYEK
jgi:hypothetical protein